MTLHHADRGAREIFGRRRLWGLGHHVADRDIEKSIRALHQPCEVTRGHDTRQGAALHPGGVLGRKLLLRVSDVMLSRDLPLLTSDRPMRECVVLLAEKRGTVAVVDKRGT